MNKKTLNRKEFAAKINRSERTVQYWKSNGLISDYTNEEIIRLQEDYLKLFTKGGNMKDSKSCDITISFLEKQFKNLFESELKKQFEEAYSSLIGDDYVCSELTVLKVHNLKNDSYSLWAGVENRIKIDKQEFYIYNICFIKYDEYGYLLNCRLGVVPFTKLEEEIIDKLELDYFYIHEIEKGDMKFPLVIFPKNDNTINPKFIFDSVHIYLITRIIMEVMVAQKLDEDLVYYYYEYCNFFNCHSYFKLIDLIWHKKTLIEKFNFLGFPFIED